MPYWLRQVLHRVDEAQAEVVGQKADRVAALAAAEAVIELLGRADRERRRFLGMERAQSGEVGAGLLQLHMPADHLHDVGARDQILEKDLGDGHGGIVAAAGVGPPRRCNKLASRRHSNCGAHRRRPTMPSIFDQDLPRNEANFAPLSPLSFLERAAEVYPDRSPCCMASATGALRRSWRELYARCRQLASALSANGIGKNDTVAVMLPNTPPMVEAHFGVPMAGAVLNAMNTRLDAQTIAFMLDHGEAKVVHRRPGVRATVQRKRSHCASASEPLLVIDVEDALYRRRQRAARQHDYEAFVADGRRRIRLAPAGRRVGRDRAELHQRHHRQPEGRRLPPPRRGDQRDLQHPRVGHAQARGLPVDAADVPLQRLVLSVDGGGARGRQRLPAQGRGAGRSSTRSARTASRTTAARRSCTACWSTPATR